VIIVPKILIVEDDMTMFSLLTTLLQMEGFDVAGVRDWRKIIETVHAENPDLVLMDYVLPDVDGIEIMKQIREQPDLAKLKVMLTSGMDVSEECIEAGADSFLLKPYTPDQLIDLIEINLGGRREIA
jgi:DNA-binding response OmpR family regulator